MKESVDVMYDYQRLTVKCTYFYTDYPWSTYVCDCNQLEWEWIFHMNDFYQARLYMKFAKYTLVQLGIEGQFFLPFESDYRGWLRCLALLVFWKSLFLLSVEMFKCLICLLWMFILLVVCWGFHMLMWIG